MRYIVWLVAILHVTYGDRVPTNSRRTGKPIVYPTDGLQPSLSKSPLKIPENVLIQMKNVNNISDFITRFASVPSQAVPTAGKDSVGGDSIIGRKPSVVGLSGNSISPAAGCETTLQVIELEKPRDPSIVYWPMCTRVARCSGCCTSELLECVPSKTSKLTVNVLEAKYTGGVGSDSFQPIGVKNFRLEKHDKCQCQCKERAEHCGPLHIYRADECRCLCTNTEAQRKCNTPDKVWDLRDCACKCKSVNECSTGLFYNPTSCRCENLRAPLRPRISGRLLALPRTANRTLERSSNASDDDDPYIAARSSQHPSIVSRMWPLEPSNETVELSSQESSNLDPFRDDGGENDTHRRRYIGIRPPDSEGVYSLAVKRIRGRTRPIVPVNVTANDES